MTENGELIKTDLETAEILNDSFSNMVQSLDNTKYSISEPFLDDIKDSAMKAILKYRNYASIVGIINQYKIGLVLVLLKLTKKKWNI